MGWRTNLWITLVVFLAFIFSSTASASPQDIQSNKDKSLATLSQLISQSTEALQAFKEAASHYQQEIAKYKPLAVSNIQRDSLKVATNHGGVPRPVASPDANRFTQVKSGEPVVADEIRDALYATQPVSSPAQANIAVYSTEDPEDIVKNAEDVATFSNDGTRDYFEEELYRMKRELNSSRRLENIKNNAQLLTREIGRLMVHKPDTTERLPEFMKKQQHRLKSTMDSNVEDVYKRCKDAACRDEHDPSTVANRGNRALPPTRSELGRAGWLYLHSMAANFPDKPTELDSLKAKAWCYSFAELYPCHICKEGLAEIYHHLPPVTNTRKDLLLWTYDLHNRVNDDLSYPRFVSSYEDLLRKYKS
ncbi:Erv1 Alr family protein [Babesia ovis]|uniref:Sulfhydryl oxidase n=1 Tax=Babesia ovis TaxID=5869 RepID=A0A9W5TBQ8_BABOV|nr:Erv1 Alr family protein [Babesia ovis]